MHFLDPPTAIPAIAPQEHFFLEMWFGMTHQLSFDSYRVRCFNARTILRELNDELRINLLPDLERKEVCAEALAILDADPVFKAAYPRHWTSLEPLLKTPPAKKDPNKPADAAAAAVERRFRFAVADTLVTLEASYFKDLLRAFQAAIAAGPEETLRAITGALLSDLVDQGWPLQSLHSWVDFLTKRPKHLATFADGLGFMLKQLEWPPQAFTVALKLSGSRKLNELGSLAGFKFLETPTVELPKHAVKAHASFVEAGENVCFAETVVKAVDFVSAGIAAVEDFEQCLDRLRYNYVASPLDIQPRVLCRREGDKKTSFPEIRTLVPNPSFLLPGAEFTDFGLQLDGVLARHDIAPESRERLQAAMRHYRFGRDAESYKDMCLNWWMGLEFLAKVAEGNIGETVGRHASDMLVRRHLLQSLEDAVKTLQKKAVAWSPNLAAVSGVPTLADLRPESLLPLLQSVPCTDEICVTLAVHPGLVFLLRQLAVTLRTPQATAQRLEEHHLHLKWQLARVYRVRCNIVHGSRLVFRLGLLSANLEIYLRELLMLCVRSFARHPHIRSLHELFQRAQISRERLIAELKAGDATAIPRAAFGPFILG